MFDKGFEMGCWIILDYNRESTFVYKDMADKVAYQVRPHFIRRTYPKRGGLGWHCPQRHARLGGDLIAAAWQVLRGQQTGPPRTMCARRPVQGMTHKYGGKLG
jgi:hypothetical protein